MKPTVSEQQSGRPGPADAGYLPASKLVEDRQNYTRSHLRFGWWSLLLFLTVGMVLEGLHAFKVPWYLNVSTQTRRLLWTLSHAHGTALGLVHLAFAFTTAHFSGWTSAGRRTASVCLKAASILLPGGFFLGGAVVHQGDPGIGILLVPLGAVLLFVAVAITASATKASNLPAGSDARRK